MMVTGIAKSVLKRTILKPLRVTHCSQTIYESLLGCLRMWEATHDELWRSRADKLLVLLKEIQCPDGGFDIGYEFHFGRLHRIGEATSPELKGLLAMSEYGRVFGLDAVRDSTERAADWIRRNAMEIKSGCWAIPYAPYTLLSAEI